MNSMEHEYNIRRSLLGLTPFCPGLVGLIVILAGTFTPLLAADQVPIRGRVIGTTTVELETGSTPNEPLFRVTNRARGNLSHLGRTVADWKVRDVSIDMANWEIAVQRPNWFGTLKAANGDEIHGEYVFVGDSIPILASGDITFGAFLHVIGGTGRFADASGTAISIGTANILTGNFEIEIRGVITTVGRGRK